MPDLLTVRAGDRVAWHAPTHGTRAGVVERVGTDAESARTDALMGREAGVGLATFGRLLHIRCDHCPCSPDREGWLHSVNESQLADVDIDVPLFDFA